jgi:hypothetical protein
MVCMVQVGDDAAPPALDPEGVCARCHAFGTVARVTTQSDPPRSARYCGGCWPEVRREQGLMGARPKPPETAAEWVTFYDRHHQPPRSSESRSWLDTMDFIKLMTEDVPAEERDHPKRPQTLARFAADIRSMEHKMDGPMPPEVEAFVQRYHTPDA